MKALPIALAASVIAACGNEPAEKPPPPPPPAPGSVHVVSPGMPPYEPLRYRVAKGTRTHLEVVLDVDVDAGGQGGTLPSFVMTTELAIDDVLADGTAKLRATIVDMTTRDREGSLVPAAQLDDAMQLMRGLVTTGTLASNGALRELAIEPGDRRLPPALATQIDNLSRSIEQIAMPLPDEPVGLGASWTQQKTFEQGGLELTTTTTFTLVSREGGRFAFTSRTELGGKDQTVTQNGTTVRVSGLRGEGTGKGTVDLARLALDAELAHEMSSEMSAQDQTARMRMKMATRIRPTSAPSAGDAN